MKSMRLANEQKIGEAYDQGREAVIVLFNKTFLELVERIQALEDQVAKNSRNSGKPPLSDGLSKPAPNSQRKRHGRKQPGRPVDGQTNPTKPCTPPAWATPPAW
ncbi:MAG: DUF6444 domain-containing protein [Anaerolineae bacterium]|nr:DUF6444 domain-containing protein [Anaerolineae bacterium]